MAGGVVALMLGLVWLIFSKPLSAYAVKYYDWLRVRTMAASDWRIIIVMMGCMACGFGSLALFGVIHFKH